MFHTTKFLYAFFFVGAIIGFISNIIDKKLPQQVSPYTILVVDSTIFIVALIISMAFLGKYKLIKKELFSLSKAQLAYLIFGGIISVISSIFFLFILKHHDLGRTRVVAYAFEILITMIGAILIFDEKLTYNAAIGLFMVLGGFVLFEYKK